ncbi:MAG: type II secretion system protein [Planctomycetota bacterium]
MKNKHAGFTLIELLVVMSILSLLVVALLPMVTSGQAEGNKTVDAANLRWHYQGFTAYKIQYGYPPRYGGHRFIFDPWMRRMVPRTKDSINRYFSPTQAGDARWMELAEDTDLKDVWRNIDDITSEDTSYAGRALEFKRGMDRDEQAWMASDNEGMNHYQDGTILVLMNDGIVRRLKRDPDLIRHGWPEGEDDEEFVYEVGRDSPHPLLRKLER